jgi:peptidyl-prolyl cis-trans isomerase D
LLLASNYPIIFNFIQTDYAVATNRTKEYTRKMLGIMRKYKESIVIKAVFIIIVLSFIGTIFLVWGQGGSGSGKQANYAAKVDSTKISLDDYQQSYYRLRGIYEQIYQRSISPEIEKQLGLKKMALDNLVEAVLVRKAAKKMGISVSEDEVKTAIAAVPAFQKNGAFDFQQYQQTLKGNRMTAADFEASQKNELLMKKARKTVQDKVVISDADAESYFHKKNDRIELQYVSIAPEALVAEVKLTDQDLNTYIQGHQELFKSAEQVSIQYVLIDPSSLVARVTVTEEEINSWYQKNIDRYQGKGGILPLAEVKDKVKADATRNKAGKEAYEKAADTINKNITAANLQAVATALGGKISDTPLFPAKNPPAALAAEEAVVKKAFMLKAGEMAGPLETSKGIYAIKLKERKPAEVPPLAQIRSAVEAVAKIDRAKELAAKKAEETLAALAKNPAAVKLQDSGSFTYNEQGNIPGIGASKDLMEAAFALTTATPLPKNAFKIDQKWLVIKLKNRTAAKSEDFQKAKEELKKQLLPKKQQEALDAWIKELKAAAKIDINQQLIAD